MTKEITDLIKEEAAVIYGDRMNYIEEGAKIYNSMQVAAEEAFEAGATLYAGKMLEFIKWKDENCQDCGEDEWTIGPTGKVYTTSELLIKYLKK